MRGQPAKVISESEVRAALTAGRARRYPLRNAVMVLLTVKAGLRACEVARLDWRMVVDAKGRINTVLELPGKAAKKGSGRRIPIHPDLQKALARLARHQGTTVGPVIRSERGGPMSARAIVNWFAGLYRELGFAGCSSHSGRRTFITRAARLVSQAGGSLRDVQQLAGHRSIEQTQAY